MITKKFRHSFVFDDELVLFWRQYNHVLHYAFNRFSDSNGEMKISDVEMLVKSNMRHIELLDASFIKQAVIKANDIYKANKNEDGSCEKVVFGGKYNFRRRYRHLIDPDVFRENVLMPIRVTGSKNDRGNRKFEFDLRNHRVCFKRDKNHHYDILFKGLSKNDEELLYALQDMYDSDRTSLAVTVELDREYIYICFDESIFGDKNYVGMDGRYASIDMNPNYIAFIIQENGNILLKELYSIKELNDLDDKKHYQDKADKKRWRHHLNNKKKHETLHISKSIIKKCVHYRVSAFVIEDLNIKSKDSGKGKQCNKLVLNHWQRNLLFNNLRKRCNLSGIEFAPVWAGYSSIKGQLEHDDEIDSIAAAIEIGNRKGKDLKDFGDTRVELGRLSNRWKNEIAGNFKRAPSWKQVAEFLKRDSTPSYRNLFSETNSRIRVSHSLSSPRSCVKLYDFI